MCVWWYTLVYCQLLWRTLYLRYVVQGRRRHTYDTTIFGGIYGKSLDVVRIGIWMHKSSTKVRPIIYHQQISAVWSIERSLWAAALDERKKTFQKIWEKVFFARPADCQTNFFPVDLSPDRPTDHPLPRHLLLSGVTPIYFWNSVFLLSSSLSSRSSIDAVDGQPKTATLRFELFELLPLEWRVVFFETMGGKFPGRMWILWNFMEQQCIEYQTNSFLRTLCMLYRGRQL